MLGSSDLVAFVPTTDLARATSFYGETLGLVPSGETPIARMFTANGTPLRVTLVEHLTPAPYTVLGWSVKGIEGVVRSLLDRGVAFATFPGMEQDELGIWTSPGGDRVASFRDPDGNVLSLTEGE